MQPRLRLFFLLSFFFFLHFLFSRSHCRAPRCVLFWPRYTSLPCVRFRPTYICIYIYTHTRIPHRYLPPCRASERPRDTYTRRREVPRVRSPSQWVRVHAPQHRGSGSSLNTPLCASPEDARPVSLHRPRVCVTFKYFSSFFAPREWTNACLVFFFSFFFLYRVLWTRYLKISICEDRFLFSLSSFVRKVDKKRVNTCCLTFREYFGYSE